MEQVDSHDVDEMLDRYENTVRALVGVTATAEQTARYNDARSQVRLELIEWRKAKRAIAEAKKEFETLKETLKTQGFYKEQVGE